MIPPKPPNPRLLTLGAVAGKIVAISAALTVMALWAGLVIGIVIRTIRLVNQW